MDSEPLYTLHYFGLYARAEPIRMLLNKAGVNFVDRRVTFEEWGEIKPTMPGGVLPVLEFKDSTMMGESLDIFRYVAEQHGFIPEGFGDDVNNYFGVWKQVLEAITPPPFVNDPEVKEQKIQAAFEQSTNFLKEHDAAFGSGQWLVNNQLSAADFAIGSLYTNYFNNPACYGFDRFQELMNEFPNFKAYGERFAAEN